MEDIITLDREEFGINECDGSGQCHVKIHTHGCYRDFGGRCDEPNEHLEN